MSKPSAAARMGTEPLNPLLLSLAIPMMISMLVQALYNVVDSIFVSYVNEAALSAVSLAFPIQNLLIAFAVGTAVGVNAHLSKSLGEGNREEAERAAMNGLFLAVCSALGFLLFGLFGAEAFITSQTSDPLIARYGAEYLTICTVFSIGCCLQCMMEKVLVASGHSTYAMITQMVGALTNIVLDPVFIFGLFGVPRMEAAGAAIATVIGQFAGAGTAFLLNAFSNHDVTLRLRGFRPSGRTIRRIYTVGLPSIGMNAIGSVMTFGMNAILIGFSSTAVAVFGVYFKLQSFVFMPVFGLNNGMVPSSATTTARASRTASPARCGSRPATPSASWSSASSSRSFCPACCSASSTPARTCCPSARWRCASSRSRFCLRASTSSLRPTSRRSATACWRCGCPSSASWSCCCRWPGCSALPGGWT